MEVWQYTRKGRKELFYCVLWSIVGECQTERLRCRWRRDCRDKSAIAEVVYRPEGEEEEVLVEEEK